MAVGLCMWGLMGPLSAQTDSFFIFGNWRDTFRVAMSNPIYPSGGLDSRRSYLGGQPVVIQGYRAGMDLGPVGAYVGYYHCPYTRVDSQSEYRYRYLSLSLDYRLHQSWRWQLWSTAQVGFGGYKQQDLQGQVLQQGRLLPVEASVLASVRFARYFGVTGGLGARIAGGTYFSGPIYTYGFKIYGSTLWNDLKKECPECIPRALRTNGQ